MNVRILLSAIPVLLFLGTRQVAPPWAAILAGFVATAVITYANRRDRLLGVLTMYGFAIVAICAVVGIAWDNEKAYLAAGPLSDFLFVPLYVGSVFIGRPLIGGISRELMPAFVQHIPLNAPVYRWLSLAWGLYDTSQGLLRTFLLRELSVNEYVIISRMVNLPLSALMVGVTAAFVWRAARHHRGSQTRFLAPEPA